MSNPAIRTLRDEGVRLPGDDGIGQIDTEIAQRPGKYRNADEHDGRSGPPQPGGKWDRRPGHPLRIEQVSDNCQPHGEADRPQRGEYENTLLPAIERLLRLPRSEPVIEDRKSVV